MSPTFIDNDSIYFNLVEAPGWPTIYLVDQQGRIRSRYLGETHSFFAQAQAIEKQLDRLMQE
ncbi:MAG: hypothetical protein GY702_21975 [Desulfobulbaceae bacterium]|nr:hypothetical protein [Desulfobulbaceae bacterium]